MSSPVPRQDYSDRLHQLNQGKATLFTIFDDSLPATFGHVSARLRRRLRIIHVDLVLPVLAVVSFAVIGAGLMIYAKTPAPSPSGCGSGFQPCPAATRTNAATVGNPPRDRVPPRLERVISDYDLVKDLATLIGASLTIIFAIVGLHRDYHYKQLQKSSDYIRQWSADFEDDNLVLNKFIGDLMVVPQSEPTDPMLFNVYHSRFAELKRSADGLDRLSSLQSAILVALHGQAADHSISSRNGRLAPVEVLQKELNFFENVGLDIKNNVANSDYLKEYFYSTVIDSYELFRKYIEYLQFASNKRQLFCNFVYLAQAWEREGVRPAVPRICVRPLVITNADIIKVEKSGRREIGG